jgi:hypothetical protein
MDKDSTKNELLRLLYNETTPREAANLRQLMATDDELRNEFDMLNEAKIALPKVLFNPSDKAINNILAFSRKNTPVQA